MIGFFAENLGSIVISLALIGIVSAIAAKMVRDKKKGRCIGCDRGCGGCRNGHKANVRDKE